MLERGGAVHVVTTVSVHGIFGLRVSSHTGSGIHDKAPAGCGDAREIALRPDGIVKNDGCPGRACDERGDPEHAKTSGYCSHVTPWLLGEVNELMRGSEFLSASDCLIRKRLPLPGKLSTSTCAPCAVQMDCTMDKPSPAPPCSRERDPSTR